VYAKIFIFYLDYLWDDAELQTCRKCIAAVQKWDKQKSNKEWSLPFLQT
jgi:hypothetical protein